MPLWLTVLVVYTIGLILGAGFGWTLRSLAVKLSERSMEIPEQTRERYAKELQEYWAKQDEARKSRLTRRI